MSGINSLLPQLNLEKAKVKTFEALADGILDAAILVRRERMFRSKAEQSQAWIGTSEYCNLNRFTLSDIAVGCALDWLDFRLPEINWRADHPNLGIYFSNLNLRPSFSLTDPRKAIN